MDYLFSFAVSLAAQEALKYTVFSGLHFLIFLIFALTDIFCSVAQLVAMMVIFG